MFPPQVLLGVAFIGLAAPLMRTDSHDTRTVDSHFLRSGRTIGGGGFTVYVYMHSVEVTIEEVQQANRYSNW